SVGPARDLLATPREGVSMRRNRLQSIRLRSTGRQAGWAALAAMVLALAAAAPGRVRSAPAASPLAATPGRVDFGAVAPGATPRATVTITNRGKRHLWLRTQAPGGPFAVGGAGLVRVAAGGQSAVTVRFAPSESGIFQGSLALAAEGAPFRVSVPLS